MQRDITKLWMQQYLLSQKEGRRGNGFTIVYEDVRQFRRWLSREEEFTSPMAGIPRPQSLN